MPEDGGNGVRQFHREDLLRRPTYEMFRSETAEGLLEMVLDGQMPTSRVPKARPRSRQCSLLILNAKTRGKGYRKKERGKERERERETFEYSSSRDVNTNSQGCNILSSIYRRPMGTVPNGRDRRRERSTSCQMITV